MFQLPDKTTALFLQSAYRARVIDLILRFEKSIDNTFSFKFIESLKFGPSGSSGSLGSSTFSNIGSTTTKIMVVRCDEYLLCWAAYAKR